MGVDNSALEAIENSIARFDPISLQEMDSVKLLNRTDTKFVFHRELLPAIFNQIQSDYRMLEIDGTRKNTYRTLYYDTPDFRFFTLHHNGKKNRYKVRFRKYVDSGLCFLEIKYKNNKGRTVKSRKRVKDIETTLSPESRAYITEVMGFEIPLVPKLWNGFTRVTLVSNIHQERLTIDSGLQFDFEDQASSLANIIIAEVKQEKQSRNSTFVQTLKDFGIHPMRISKFCTGALHLYPELKYNNFKAKMRKLNKINHEPIVEHNG